ncbi:MAG: phage tail tube protein [Methanosarcinaceae archaeon]
MAIYIPTRAKLGWAEETAYDEDSGQTATDMTHPFGIHDEDVDLPDPENKTNFYRFCGYGPDSKTGVLVSRDLRGSLPFLLDDGRMLGYAVGGSVTTGPVAGIYTHTLNGYDQVPNSIRMESQWYNGTNYFVRRYTGVACERFTLSAAEEEVCKISMDVVASRAIKSTVDRSTITCPTNTPFIFHHGSCKFWGTEVKRVTDWSLTHNRAFSLRRYITEAYAAGDIGKITEVNAGNRDWELSATVVAIDDNISGGYSSTNAWDELLDPTSGGFDVELLLARTASEDQIKITSNDCVLRTAPHPDTDGEDSPITMDIVPQSVEIEIMDSFAGSSYFE